MRTIHFLSTILTFSLLLFSCNKEAMKIEEDQEEQIEDLKITDPIVIQLNTVESTLAESDKDFSMDLFSFVYDQNAKVAKKENIMISPFSLSTALAMVWNGANGETRTAIQNTLGFENYTSDELNGYYKKMKDALLSTDPSVKLAIANSIWYRKGAIVNDEFVQTNKNWYKAQVEAIDFKLPSAVNIINKWCSDNTNGLIKDVLKQIAPDDIMFLLNALYFKGTWGGGYEFKESDTKPASFRKEDGTSVTVNMMNNKAKMLYYTDETLSAVNLPYGNGAFSMMLMLPQENVSMSAMVTKLKSPSYWHNMMNGRTSKEVAIQIPKFKIEYNGDLIEVLKQMGMAIAFEPFLADFTKIFPLYQTYISKVDQFTYIDVNEKGTEAAAVTIIGASVTSWTPPVTFTANRPFVFAICEKSTGCVLFMGMVGNPG